MIKLSFIVPVYNIEKYLRKCVESLINQDYSNYEIILVDDGSTDNSGAICDELASKSPISNLQSPIIRVIHQPNAGLSAARNSGIKAANGEYICFVDSDDYWQPNVLAGLMAQIERDNLDVLRFKYQHVNDQYEVYMPYKADPYRNDDYSKEVTDGVSFLNSRFGTACYAVMFIIRRAMLFNDWKLEIGHWTLENGDCLFTEGIYFEDTDWTPRMLCRARRVASTDTIVYNYLVRQGSISRAISHEKQQKVLDDKMRLVGEMQRQAMDFEQKGLSNGWFKKMIAATVISIVGILSIDFYKERRAYLDQLKKMDVYPIASKSIKARLINISPRLAVELLHLKNSH